MKMLKFRAVLVPKLWGGEAIAHLKGLKSAPVSVGESFELSALPGQETICTTEGYEGQTLTDLIARYGAELVGRANIAHYGTQFPLLIKFIDARQALSVQVHPDDAMASSLGMPCGKSEMWYVVDTAPKASLMAGFVEDIDASRFEEMLADGSLMRHVNVYATSAGDAYYIPAGTIHSIGAGNFIIEVQQSSGATYRVYDFDRTDEAGHKRELHVDLARRALNFSASGDFRRHIQPVPCQPITVVRSPYFVTELLRADAPASLDLAETDSFVAIVCFEGAATLTDQNGCVVRLTAGETLLIPASMERIDLRPDPAFACLTARV